MNVPRNIIGMAKSGWFQFGEYSLFTCNGVVQRCYYGERNAIERVAIAEKAEDGQWYKAENVALDALKEGLSNGTMRFSSGDG